MFAIGYINPYWEQYVIDNRQKTAFLQTLPLSILQLLLIVIDDEKMAPVPLVIVKNEGTQCSLQDILTPIGGGMSLTID